ncbi:unnamed protein product [Rhizophagus irregularis]|uniref:Uncharacterized protein n=1 Tax=Rhizophagus irregularis TaxID=588596 RepID=A0A2I1H8F9_9GLOM|nr:hypothetical protein RhiirA4_474396 [Rhizophagus irregularis]CAB4427974.1 unnamed protein product [Rhizophagus irregularis]
MDEDMGKGLQIKSQDELIGEEGTYKKRFGVNRFKVQTQTNSKDKFVDAQSEPLSTIPRTKEEHEELDNLNNDFSKRLEKEVPKVDTKGKKKAVEEEDIINKNKKRVVTTQGREDSDNE